MTHSKTPFIMGGAMGLMAPWMMHNDSLTLAGPAFIAAHVAIIGGLAMLTLIFPKVRARLPKHRPTLRHVGVMVGVFALAWATTCAVCLAIGGQHWT